MPVAKYNIIYEELKSRIQEEKYKFQDLLPSENAFCEEFQCSRNTVRRAIAQLVREGYVQTIHGKGVRIIYEKAHQTDFTLVGIESLKEAAIRNDMEYTTKVICFVELVVDHRIQKRTGFSIGDEIFYIQRVRYMEGVPWILDHNYMRCDIVKNLTTEIAAESIYEYLENVLEEKIVTTKRKVTVERANQLDEKQMNLIDINCVAVVSSHTYNAQGIMFEYTQSRHHPEKFVFHDQAQRLK